MKHQGRIIKTARVWNKELGRDVTIDIIVDIDLSIIIKALAQKAYNNNVGKEASALNRGVVLHYVPRNDR